jgi:hypothetical protein
VSCRGRRSRDGSGLTSLKSSSRARTPTFSDRTRRNLIRWLKECYWFQLSYFGCIDSNCLLDDIWTRTKRVALEKGEGIRDIQQGGLSRQHWGQALRGPSPEASTEETRANHGRHSHQARLFHSVCQGVCSSTITFLVKQPKKINYFVSIGNWEVNGKKASATLICAAMRKARVKNLKIWRSCWSSESPVNRGCFRTSSAAQPKI